MKRLITVMMLLAITSGALAQTYPQKPNDTGQELFTCAKPWVLLRTPAAQSGTAALVLTSVDLCFYTYVGGGSVSPADAVTHIAATNGMIDLWANPNIGWGTNVVEIAFFAAGTDVANDYFAPELYVWAADSPYGPGIPLFLGTDAASLVGSMICSYHPTTGAALTGGLWVDTIAGTDCWGGVTIVDSGTDNGRICRLIVDVRGMRYLYLRLYSSAGSAKAANIGAIIRRY